MEIICTPVEIRILGCLIEKEITTPEYYPMSLNALTNACNQKTNRDPVMSLDDSDVMRALDSLREKKLVWQLNTAGGRVPKFEHNIRSLFTFTQQETALICVLMLRGAQTPGELRARTDRMCSFGSSDELVEVLKNLSKREDGPYVLELPRQPGHKENRYVHLFCGTPDVSSMEQNLVTRVSQEQPSPDEITSLREEIQSLREEIGVIRSEFAEFRKQFE